MVPRAFQLDGARIRWPYRISLHEEIVEQIDGVVEAAGLHCLLESKDWSKPISIDPIAILRNQLLRRPATTIGMVFSRSGYTEAALLLADSRTTFGLSYERLVEIARQSDLLINISGMLTDENLLSPIPVRAYLDLDPAFIQMWHAVQGIDMRLAAHTHFVTVGQSIGRPTCAVPTATPSRTA